MFSKLFFRSRLAVFAVTLMGLSAAFAPSAEAFAAGAVHGFSGRERTSLATSTATDPSSRHAGSAFAHFLASYWNSSSRTFYWQSDHRSGPTGERNAPIWWVAQAWSIVLDDYQRTNSSTDRQLIDDVYDGWIANNGWFSSGYNDDRGWWALAATRAYQLTGESRFLNTAVKLADDQWRSWDSTFGGGLWWRRNVHDQKNVATNAPAAMTNAALYQLTGRPRFKTRAIALFGWVDSKLRSGVRLDDRWETPDKRIAADYSYNYGTYIGAALDLYAITADRGYVDKATSLADSAMTRLSSAGVLRDEGTGDGGGFKGIFIRNFASLIAIRPSPISSNKAASYSSFLAHNSSVAWRYRSSVRLWGGSWTSYPPSGAIDVLTDTSAVSLFEAEALTSP